MKTLTNILALIILPLFLHAQMVINANINLAQGAVMHSTIDVVINSGNLHLGPGSTLSLGDNQTLTVNNGGTISLKGNNTAKATVTSTGFFVFYINGGGTISANHAKFEKISGSGLTIQQGGIIDPVHSLNNSVFSNGAAGSTFLTINNNQVLTIDNVAFIAAPGNELFNVAKTLDIGMVTFANYSGNFAGEAFENDAYNRIEWGGMPSQLYLEDLIISMGLDTCFAATQTITLAGNGTTFTVQAGGSALLVAGYNVLLLPGMLVQNGGYLHAYIDTGGIYCSNARTMISSQDHTPLNEINLPELFIGKSDFRIYPNPTTGWFTLETSAANTFTHARVDIHNAMGALIHKIELPGGRQFEFNLVNYPKGVYIIRIIENDVMFTGKVIRQ